MINQQPIAQYLRKNAEVLCDFPEINGVTQTVKYMTKFHVWENYAPWKCPILTLSWRGPLLYRNQSIDLQSKSMDGFLYDNDLRHERVKIKNLYPFSLLANMMKSLLFSCRFAISQKNIMKAFVKLNNIFEALRVDAKNLDLD